MRERALFVGLVLSCSGFLVTSEARAEPWGEGRAGAGLGSGHWSFEKGYTDRNGVELVARDEGGPVGVAVVLEAMGGYAVSPTVAFGLYGRLELTPYLESVKPRYSSVDSHLLTGFGPLLVFRPGKTLDLRLGLEWTTAHFSGGNDAIGADDNVFEVETPKGVGALLSLGCCSEPGWGIAAEMHAARLTSDHTTFIPLTFALMATFASR